MGKFVLPKNQSLDATPKKNTKRVMKFEKESFDDMITKASSPKKKKREPLEVVYLDLSVYTDDARIFRSSLPPGKLYSLAIRHDSLTYDMKRNLEGFTSTSIAVFERAWNLLYVSNNDEDEDEIGQEAYLKGFLIEGAMKQVKNVICYVDSFAIHRRETDDRANIPETLTFKIANYTGQPLIFAPDELSHNVEVISSTGIGSLIKLQPPVPSKRMLIANIHCLPDNHVQVVFDGETYVFRSLFGAGNVTGKYVDGEGNEVDSEASGAVYTRGFPPCNLTNTKHVDHLISFLGDGLEQTVYVVRTVTDEPLSDIMKSFHSRISLETRGIVFPVGSAEALTHE